MLGSRNVDEADVRKSRPPRGVRVRTWRQGAGGSVAAAQIVGADQKITFGIQSSSRPDEVVPPTGRAFVGPKAVRLGKRLHLARHVVASGKSVKDQNRVVAARVEAAMGRIGEGVLGEGSSVGERKRRRAAIESRGLQGGRRRAHGFWRLFEGARSSTYPWDAASAWSTSARMSSICSRPTERRTNSGEMPPASCCSGESCEWVVVAG